MILVLFGVTSDLAKKKLLPAIFALHRKRKLPGRTTILCFGRKKWNDLELRHHIGAWMRESGTKRESSSFLERFFYVHGAFEEREGYRTLRLAIEYHRKKNKFLQTLFYLAIPPGLYVKVVKSLISEKLLRKSNSREQWIRIGIEKPFDNDYRTAKKLHELLSSSLYEQQIYPVDHYLHKKMVRNLFFLRFQNRKLKLLSKEYEVKDIHVKLLEREGVGTRSASYDSLGALRDVGQNHILSMLSLLLMGRSGQGSENRFRKSRAEVIEHLRFYRSENFRERAIRGQYRGYRTLHSVAQNSPTETYFKIIANFSLLEDALITLESGKSMDRSLAEASIVFISPDGTSKTRTVRFLIKPEEKVFLDGELVYSSSRREENAYESVFLSIARGDTMWFLSKREIFASWKFIDPIREAWDNDKVPLRTYSPGAKIL